MFNEYYHDVYPMPNSDFTVEDFCKDPNFIGWILNPTDKSNQFWFSFIANNPHKQSDIQKAAEFIKTMRFRELDPTPQDLIRLKERIRKDIDQSVRHRVAPYWIESDQPVRKIKWFQRHFRTVFAVILLVLSGGLGWLVFQENLPLTFQTAYGKVQEIKLADGSLVTLNANSQLKVTDNIADLPVREVWLKGEAYFDIAKRKGAKFIVHTPEAQIEVLGTEFNVNTRREQTHVVLETGKIQLSTDLQSTVVMSPGDMATVLQKSRQIQLKRVQPENYDAWKQSYLVLDGKSLPEIINRLEDTFGLKIKLDEAQLSEKKLSGKLSTKVAQDCIENLAIILDADVKKEGDTYVFK